MKDSTKKALFKSIDRSVITIPAVQPEVQTVFETTTKTKVVAWQISLAVVSSAMISIVGSMALVVVYCNKADDEELSGVSAT